MARPVLKSALGREAVYSDKGASSPPARPARPPKPGSGGTWEETHSRATYHLPRKLQDAVTEVAAKTGRSKSQVVSDAIRQHLKLKG